LKRRFGWSNECEKVLRRKKKKKKKKVRKLGLEVEEESPKTWS